MIVVGAFAQIGSNTNFSNSKFAHSFSAISKLNIYAAIHFGGHRNVTMANYGSLTITVLMSSQLWVALKAYWNTLSSKGLTSRPGRVWFRSCQADYTLTLPSRAVLGEGVWF